jgi:trigger factor
MSLNVQVEQVEKTSPIQRKLTIRVTAQEVAARYQRGLAEVQRTATLKGFRPGQAPISVIKQFYGEDVRHRLFHNLIDESYQTALRDQKIRAVGSPKIETPNHQTGAGEHDHTLHEDKDLTFTATVEILPEIEPKGYTGVSLTRDKFDVTDADVQTLITLTGDQFLGPTAQSFFVSKSKISR